MLRRGNVQPHAHHLYSSELPYCPPDTTSFGLVCPVATNLQAHCHPRSTGGCEGDDDTRNKSSDKLTVSLQERREHLAVNGGASREGGRMKHRIKMLSSGIKRKVAED
jgi:hypothetical protein